MRETISAGRVVEAGQIQRALKLADTSDEGLVQLARDGEAGAFRTLVQRYNRRVYRVARSVLKDESEAEDVVQESYVRAFAGLARFRGDAAFSTWITRIAVNEAVGRIRRRRKTLELAVLETACGRGGAETLQYRGLAADADPERAAAHMEVRRLIERAIDRLPEGLRMVFVLRDIEGMSTEETAGHLGIRPETVKTRLHRARRRLRKILGDKTASTLSEPFPFAGARCARTTNAVLVRLGMADAPDGERVGGAIL